MDESKTRRDKCAWSGNYGFIDNISCEEQYDVYGSGICAVFLVQTQLFTNLGEISFVDQPLDFKS